MCFENEPTTQCFLVFCLLPRGKVHSPADCPRDTSRIRSRIVFLFLNLRREPMFEFVFDASLFAFAYATPPFVFESL